MDLNLFCGTASDAGARPLVLVVDSYADNLFLMEELLKLCGCLTALAADSFTALQVADCQRPDLILTELVLPEISGIDLVKQLRALAIPTPIVAVTSCLSSQYEAQALQAGCDEFVEKPFSLEELEAIIARFLSPQPSPVSA